MNSLRPGERNRDRSEEVLRQIRVVRRQEALHKKGKYWREEKTLHQRVEDFLQHSAKRDRLEKYIEAYEPYRGHIDDFALKRCDHACQDG